MSAPRVVLFGGTGALGRVVAETLAREGARVAFTYHCNESAARELCASLPNASCRRLDLGTAADIPRAIDDLTAALGGVDAFVHCAALFSTQGAGTYDRLSDVTEAGFDHLLAVNVKSAFFAAQRLAEVMTSGNLVFVASISGVKLIPAPAPYALTTGALVALVKALAKDLGPRGLRANVVAPGLLDAGLSTALPADLRADYLTHTGLRRAGTRQEAAELITYLALHNTYVTGQTLVADGGL